MQWMEITVYLSTKATDRGREGPALGYYYLPPAIWVRDRRRRVLLSCILTNGRIQWTVPLRWYLLFLLLPSQVCQPSLTLSYPGALSLRIRSLLSAHHGVLRRALSRLLRGSTSSHFSRHSSDSPENKDNEKRGWPCTCDFLQVRNPVWPNLTMVFFFQRLRETWVPVIPCLHFKSTTSVLIILHLSASGDWDSATLSSRESSEKKQSSEADVSIVDIKLDNLDLETNSAPSSPHERSVLNGSREMHPVSHTSNTI